MYKLSFTIVVCLFLTAILYSCGGDKQKSVFQTKITNEEWGKQDDRAILLFTLSNKNGMSIKVSNYGATLVNVSAPDRNGKFEPVVLGFDSLQNYLGRHPNFGSTIGRYANRISNAEFSLNNETYHLKPNRGKHIIHGGSRGFSRQIFDVDDYYVANDTAVLVLTYLSPDMEEGFPGNLSFRITYKLTENNEIMLEYEATTDKPTVVNFTNHSYFNLSGCKEPVLNHVLNMDADSVMAVDTSGIPTGTFSPVIHTPYDFTEPRSVGERIADLPKGYDVTYKLRKKEDELSLVATLYEPVSGRVLKAYTTEPGMQLFTGSSELSRITGHGGIQYKLYYGLCLEMQHFPDSPNNPSFPRVVLEPDSVYRQTTIYKFETISS